MSAIAPVQPAATTAERDFTLALRLEDGYGFRVDFGGDAPTTETDGPPPLGHPSARHPIWTLAAQSEL